MYARITSRPYCPTMRRSSSTPFSLAATCALRSARFVSGFLDGYSALVSRCLVSVSRSRPSSTSSQLSISTPSSSMRVLAAGIEPGDMPPISAW